MKAIIIDDEEHCITTLTWTLTEYCKDIEVIATAQNGEEGIEKIQKFKPDLKALYSLRAVSSDEILKSGIL